MDTNTLTISKTVSDISQGKPEVQTVNGTWRLRQAIDLVIDYIMQLEEKSSGETNLKGDANVLSF